jgi:hypothetical protein
MSPTVPKITGTAEVFRRRSAAAPDPQDHPEDEDPSPEDSLPVEEETYEGVDEETYEDEEYDDYDEEESEAATPAPAPARRSGGLLSRLNLFNQPDRTPVDDSDLKPTQMRGNEALYGYILAVELVVVSVLNLTFTHGKGAPAHPPTTLSAVGLVVSVGFGALVRTHNRFIVSFAALIAAFFVTLPRIPQSLFVYHVFGLIFPLIYALVLMQRQRKATLARTGSTARQTPAQRRADADTRRRERRQQKRGAPPPPKVAPNRRYTPPKAKRPRPPQQQQRPSDRPTDR